jgi:hypothetical protein
MTIVRLKTLEQDKKVNELLKTFGLPHIDYPNGYQSKPRPELVGASASAMNPTEALGLKAVNELFRWTRRAV